MISKDSDFRDLYNFKVTVNGIEVTPMVMDLKIFQDMFIPFYTGSIHMYDQVNFVDKIKIGSTVNIRMETRQGFGETDGQLDKTFEIYNIGDRRSDKQRNQNYIIYIASKQMNLDSETRVVQSFKNKPPATIIRECLGKINSGLSGVVDSEPSNTISYVAANLTPLMAANMALRATTPRTDYFLYPSILDSSGNNQYELGSLEDLIKKPPIMKFNQYTYNTSEMRYQNQNLQIRSPHINQLDDLTNKLIGYNANTLNTLDINERQWETTEKEYVGKTKPNIVTGFQPIVKEQFDEGEALPEKSKEWMQDRKNNLFKVMQFPVMFGTFGFCKSWDLYSKVINLDLDNQDITIRNISPNQLIANKPFLVTAVTHHVNHRGDYRNSFRAITWQIKTNYGA